MGLMDLIWYGQQAKLKLFLLWILALFVSSVVRFVKLWWRIARHSGMRLSVDEIVRGNFEPDLLATIALAKPSPCDADLEKSTKFEGDGGDLGVERSLYLLRAADIRFLFLWERYYAVVRSSKWAGSLTCLLSLIMVIYGVFPTYSRYHNDTNLDGTTSFLLAAEQLTTTLAFGLFLAAILYVGASHFERLLMQRKACWNYFSSKMKNDLS